MYSGCGFNDLSAKLQKKSVISKCSGVFLGCFINSPQPTPNRMPSSSGAARAEAKLVWIMPSRDRARRSQDCLNG